MSLDRRSIASLPLALGLLLAACTSSRISANGGGSDLVFLAGIDDAELAMSAAAAIEDCSGDATWGVFPVEAKYTADPVDGDIDVLEADFQFIDKGQRTWTARKALRWNGCSIPRALWTVVGSPKTGCHKLPSIVHDEYYQHHAEYTFTRKEVDQMFYEACRAKGVGRSKAGTMYYALRWFGDRWSDEAPVEHSLTNASDQARFLQALEEHLDARADDGAEHALLEMLDKLPPEELAATLVET